MTSRTLRTIAWREWTDLVRDGRFSASGAIILLLLSAALGAAALHVRALRAERAAAQQTTYEQWLDQGRRNAHSATHYGIYAFKPQSTLALVDPGLDRVTGTTTFLESHKRNLLALRPARDSADVWRFADLSAAAILQLLIPLWILLLTFVSVAGGRESGLLRYLASFGVHPVVVGAGTALGTALAVGTLVVPASIVGALAIVVTSAGEMEAVSAGRVLALAVVYLGCFLVFLALGIAVSARSRTPRTALLALIAFWAAGGLALPRAASDFAAARYPLPSNLEFVHQVNRQLLESEHDRTARLIARTLGEHGVERVDELPFNFTGLDLQDSEELGNRVFDEVYADLYSRMDAQTRLHQWSSLFSPLQSVRLLSMAVSGTDHAHERHFADAAEEYRRLMVRLMNDAVRDGLGEVDEGYVGTQTLNRMADRDVWALVPPLTYAPPGLGAALWAARGAAVGLVAWLVAALLLATLALERLRVDP
jgi:ABC-2 type transport system permease protein